MVFWILILLVALAVYFILSYAFDFIGKIVLKGQKTFNKNIGIKRRKK